MKTICLRGVALACCTMFVFLGINLLNIATYDDVYRYTRTTMHEFYEQKNIDILCVGSSHCCAGIDPTILDEVLKVNSFNASTSSQNLDGTYYVLLEAVKKKNIDTIVLDLSYSSSRQTIERDKRSQEDYTNTATYILSDYIEDPFIRTYYLLNATSEDKYDETFLPFRRTNSKLDIGTFAHTVWKKSQPFYTEYQHLSSGEVEYLNKGFIADYHYATKEEYTKAPYHKNVDLGRISSTWFNYLQKITDLCHRNKIRLIFINIPEPMYLINSYGNYDEYIDYITEIAEVYGIEYYNFNLLNEDIFPDDRNLFKDNNHLNYDGAEKFTEILSEVIANPEIFEDITYFDSTEKLKSLGYGE